MTGAGNVAEIRQIALEIRARLAASPEIGSHVVDDTAATVARLTSPLEACLRSLDSPSSARAHCRAGGSGMPRVCDGKRCN